MKIFILLSIFIFSSQMIHASTVDELGAKIGYKQWEGHWCRNGMVVGSLQPGTVFKDLPARHDSVVIKGIQYYYDGAHYFKKDHKGWVVIDPK